MRTFVIGDIHGCHAELNALVDALIRDFKVTYADRFLFTGDYINRGPDSRGVIEYLITLDRIYRCTFLRGNHEDMFLAWLNRGGNFGDVFLYNNGLTTLRSYVTFDNTWSMQNLKCEVYIPEQHITFLEKTKLYHDTPNILFVHAGINPDKPLDENTSFDFLWVQDNRNSYFEKMKANKYHKLIIHGHTPINSNDVKKLLPYNLINVDTGCFQMPSTSPNMGRALTCLIVDESEPPENWQIVQYIKGGIICLKK